MSKAIRIVIVFVCIAIVVAVGLTGRAWADKLNANGQAPASGVAPQAHERPNGTVPTTPQCLKTLVPGHFTVGSIAQWMLESVVQGKVYEACVVKQKDLPGKQPGPLMTSPIELMVHTDTVMGVPHRVCFPLPPKKDGYAFYWDGLTETWIKTEEAKDGQACVTVPATAKAPTFVVLSKKVGAQGG